VRDPQPGPATPRLRGVTHQWAFVASIFTGTALVLSAPSARARLAAAIYAVSVAALFASSARYHRVRWRSAAGALAGALVIAVWGGAAAGIVLTLAWIDAPEWLVALPVRATGLGRGARCSDRDRDARGGAGRRQRRPRCSTRRSRS
jgi:predicted membrane channel-forming protein YqfA (hemolysin III family)